MRKRNEALEDILMFLQANQHGGVTSSSHALKSTLAFLMGAGVVGAGAQAVDAVTGDAKAWNSGELPLNYAYQGLAGGSGAALGYFLGDRLENGGKEEIDKAIAAIPVPINKGASRQAKDMKLELKQMMKEHGVEAAQQMFADAKNSSTSEKNYQQKIKDRQRKVTEVVHDIRTRRGGNRMAGTAAGLMGGLVTILPSMRDDQY